MGRYRLSDVCPEVVALLGGRFVPLKSLDELARMVPSRQLEAANLMIALNRYSAPYVQSLVAATRPDQLVQGRKTRMKGVSQQQRELMKADSAELDEAVHLVAPFCGRDHLDLVAAAGYVRRLLQSQMVLSHLARHHRDLLSELQQLTRR